MMAKTKPNAAPKSISAFDPAHGEGKLRRIGGSGSDDFNQILADQAFKSVWKAHSDEATKDQQFQATLAAMMGIAPRDEVEGMLVTQMVAAHNNAMECHRRAMLDQQTFEGRKENLNQANKLSRTYTLLLDALNRHRGKGQQKVTVEHVHVHQGGQAIVGAVETGGGVAAGNQRQPHAKAISAPILDASLPPLRGQDEIRQPVPLAGDDEWTLPHARG
jgi:hypothetical protein